MAHYVKVEVDLDDFDDDELIEELQARGKYFELPKDDPLVYELFLARVDGNAEQFEKTLKKLFLDRLGKTV
jgi:hypothetical protein